MEKIYRIVDGKRCSVLNRRDYLEKLPVSDLEGGVESLIHYLQGLAELYPDHTLYFELHYNYDGDYISSLGIVGTRLETDDEIRERLALVCADKEAKRAKKQKIRDLEIAKLKELAHKYPDALKEEHN